MSLKLIILSVVVVSLLVSLILIQDQELTDNNQVDMKDVYSNQNPNIILTDTYDLQKNLNLKIQTLKNFIQLDNNNQQTIPFVVSVESNEMDFSKDFNSKRNGVDLICVIDNSGSMSGEKLQNVKETLKSLLEYLDEKDRISLIVFNSGSRIMQNLQYMNKQNKEEAIKIINSIYAQGGTNISSGMKQAFQILEERGETSQVTSIFLLSDGQDQESRISVKDLLRISSVSNLGFTIHSFGYGKDHDHKLMSEISSLKDGNFYYVENANQVDEYFASAVGGLFSVVAQDVTIDLKLNYQDPLFQRVFSELFISKVYNQDWEVIIPGKHYKIKINQFISGVSKDFVFELTIPKIGIQFTENQRQLGIITAQLEAKAINSQEVIKKNVLHNMHIFNQAEQIPDNYLVLNDQIEHHIWRVKSSEVIQEAINSSSKGEYQQAQERLKQFQGQVNGLKPEIRQKLQSVIRDVDESIVQSREDKFEAGGNILLQGLSLSNIRQYAQNLESVEQDTYSNKIQNNMVRSIKAKKQQQKEL